MNVVIVGVGGHGKVVLDILRRDIDVRPVGFLDDNPAVHGEIIEGIPVLGGTQSLPWLIERYELHGGIVAIGDNRIRSKIFNALKASGLKMKRAIHPHALIAHDVEIGEGAVIADGAIVGIGTKIGDNVIINTGVIIEHDNVIESHAHISPGVTLAGKVTIGRYAHVGLGVTIVNGLTIGENATIGAGAVVLDDVPSSATAVGIPARVIKWKEPAVPMTHRRVST